LSLEPSVLVSYVVFTSRYQPYLNPAQTI
jgi:hypothetical protein